MFTPAVLITGGQFTDQSAEIYHPNREYPCILPNIPAYYRHSQDGSLTCGGRYTDRSCWRWNNGTWDLVTKSLPERRWNPISWTPADGSVTYLMGGYWSGSTSEVIDNRSGGVKNSFRLKYDRW